MRMAWIAASLLMTGCTAMESRDTQAWLALHAVDTIQTYHAAQDPECFAEGNPLTRGLIGEHPSGSEVVAWSVGSAALHIGVAELLLRTDHPRLARVWQYVRIADTGQAIVKNHSIGIRIGSPNRGCH